MDILELNYLDIDENDSYKEIIKKVLKKCVEIEKLENKNLYVNVVLTNAKNIKSINKEHRGIDRETDVLSFPMYEKKELDDKIKNKDFEHEDVLGDIVISIEKVKGQAQEYGHSFEREFAYMIVHGFYHLMGYDNIKEEDKVIMRPKEENVLNQLGITRGELE